MIAQMAESAMSRDTAEAEVNRVYDVMLARADHKVSNSQFLRALEAGTLPPEALRVFWLNWHGFVAEINNFIQCAYQRHLGFFKRHLDLLAPFANKIADELIHPEPPGHILVVWKQGEIFGLSRQQMIDYEMLPECRALVEYHRGLLYEGTIAEFWASIAWEEYVGHWARSFRLGLEKMGYSTEQAPYFHTHEEADLSEHEGGVMAHGQFNRAVLARLLESGNGQHRPGFSLEYAACTAIDYFAWFHQASYDAAR
jgi:pyrroloquinoline quinone (PQQ) biosynthesis protein C